MIKKEYPKGKLEICVGKKGQVFTREIIDGRLVYFEWVGKNNGLVEGEKIEIHRFRTFVDHGQYIESGFPYSRRNEEEKFAREHLAILQEFCEKKNIKIIDLSGGRLELIGLTKLNKEISGMGY
jgi:hypothetical protein